MEREAYEQYRAEASNWLKQGRMRLLRAMLDAIPAEQRPLRCLEVGAGVGQNVPVLARRGSVDVVEIDELGLAALRAMPGIGRIHDRPIPFTLDETYDVVVAFDVLEHIADDRQAAAWICDHLAPGGHLIVSVPAYQWLFSDHDVALQHFRRYTRRRLVAALPAGMSVERAGYFVSLLFPLAAASRLAARLAGGFRSTGHAVRKQSSAVPGPLDRLFKGLLDLEVGAFERGITAPFGLSVICLARKPA